MNIYCITEPVGGIVLEVHARVVMELLILLPQPEGGLLRTLLLRPVIVLHVILLSQGHLQCAKASLCPQSANRCSERSHSCRR